MKKAAILTALCGIIFAGFASTCYARPNWGRFLPRPIVVPVDSLSVTSNAMFAGIDLRKYLPRPIIAPADSSAFTAPVELVAAPVTNNTPPNPWRRVLTAHQAEIVISAAPVTNNTPPNPWRRVLTA